MKSHMILPALLAVLVCSVQAQSGRDPGRWDYQNSCASCHGAMGRGDGPMVRYLVTPPSDLSRLAQRNLHEAVRSHNLDQMPSVRLIRRM